MYSTCIIQTSSHSNYSQATQRGLVSDTAENISQIGAWAQHNFTKEEQRIKLFLKLTRKNVNALAGFPLSSSFDPGFKKFCNSFSRMEKEFKTGITDHTNWASRMVKWGRTLTNSLDLL